MQPLSPWYRFCVAISTAAIHPKLDLWTLWLVAKRESHMGCRAAGGSRASTVHSSRRRRGTPVRTITTRPSTWMRCGTPADLASPASTTRIVHWPSASFHHALRTVGMLGKLWRSMRPKPSCLKAPAVLQLEPSLSFIHINFENMSWNEYLRILKVIRHVRSYKRLFFLLKQENRYFDLVLVL